METEGSENVCSEGPASEAGSLVDGAFKAGFDARRSKYGRKYKAGPILGPEDGAGIQLQEMRHVYLNPGYLDKTQGQKTYRLMLKRDPKGFMGQLAMLEKEHRLERGEARQRGVGGKDEGVREALRLCEGWLAGEEEAETEGGGIEPNGAVTPSPGDVKSL